MEATKASYGQTLLKRFMAEMLPGEPLENHRPDWLMGMELDLFWPLFNIAIEFQGDQHYLPVYGRGSLQSQQARDKQKKAICDDRGIFLIRVDAIDLQHSVLSRKLKAAFRKLEGGRRHGGRFGIRKRDKNALRRLNKEAIAYRITLKERFGSPTAYRKGNTRSAAHRAWYEAKEPLFTPPVGMTMA